MKRSFLQEIFDPANFKAQFTILMVSLIPAHIVTTHNRSIFSMDVIRLPQYPRAFFYSTLIAFIVTELIFLAIKDSHKRYPIYENKQKHWMYRISVGVIIPLMLAPFLAYLYYWAVGKNMFVYADYFRDDYPVVIGFILFGNALIEFLFWTQLVVRYDKADYQFPEVPEMYPIPEDAINVEEEREKTQKSKKKDFDFSNFKKDPRFSLIVLVGKRLIPFNRQGEIVDWSERSIKASIKKLPDTYCAISGSCIIFCGAVDKVWYDKGKKEFSIKLNCYKEIITVAHRGSEVFKTWCYNRGIEIFYDK